MAQKDLKTRVGSVKNIQKITSAMEMVAGARLRRAEQRIEALRPYADEIRQVARRAALDAKAIPNFGILQEHAEVRTVALLLLTGDRGLAGAFNSQILRAGLHAKQAHEAEGRNVVFYAIGKRGLSSLSFRGLNPIQSYTGFTDRPAFANARDVAHDLIADYVAERIDKVELFYNGYISALSQVVRHETLLPLQGVEAFGGASDSDDKKQSESEPSSSSSSLVEYEPDVEEILKQLVPDYIEISIFRAMLESTASEHGARMTAMRNASENASELIEGLTLEMNRARQAEITQEIMEVVAGAEALS